MRKQTLSDLREAVMNGTRGTIHSALDDAYGIGRRAGLDSMQDTTLELATRRKEVEQLHVGVEGHRIVVDRLAEELKVERELIAELKRIIKSMDTARLDRDHDHNAQFDSLSLELAAEYKGRTVIRKKHGAKANEGFADFVDRIAGERDLAEAALKFAENVLREAGLMTPKEMTGINARVAALEKLAGVQTRESESERKASIPHDTVRCTVKIGGDRCIHAVRHTGPCDFGSDLVCPDCGSGNIEDGKASREVGNGKFLCRDCGNESWLSNLCTREFYEAIERARGVV